MDQGGIESVDQEMSQDGSVFTWDPCYIDQGGVESEDKECCKMALYSPGTPVTWTREVRRARTKNVTRWLCIHIGPLLHRPWRSTEWGQRMLQNGSVFTRDTRDENLSPAMGRGVDSRNRVWNWVAKLHRLAGRYYNPMLTWFLAPIAGLKLPTLLHGLGRGGERGQKMSQACSVFTWGPLLHGPGRSRAPGHRMSQDGSVFTWGPRSRTTEE